MMGKQDPPQGLLFYTRFNLDQRVRADHPLRAISAGVDFGFAYDKVEHLYGANGNVSVPPPVILKLMFLLVYFNVRSERELMATLPERLDWLWFLGFDLDSSIADHSVLSKARGRWGVEVFRELFEQVVRQCVALGLVGGEKVFVDSSLIDANASEKSISTHLYQELERRLDGAPQPSDSARDEDHHDDGGPGTTKRKQISSTDPDAAVVGRRGGAGSFRARYKAHRAVDDQHGVITATLLTPGDVNEGTRLIGLIEQHEQTTGMRARVGVGDAQYGTNANFLWCFWRGIAAHMPVLREVNNNARQRRRGLFTDDAFSFDPLTDSYICPDGQTLRRAGTYKQERADVYRASPQTCLQCALKPQCTTSSRRVIRRSHFQEQLDKMRKATKDPSSRADLRRRGHFMERSFAAATRFGFKRSRWRSLWRNEIQNLLIATVQNIQVMLHCDGPKNLVRWVSSSFQKATAFFRHLIHIVDSTSSSLIPET